jgi:hypothetical protein
MARVSQTDVIKTISTKRSLRAGHPVKDLTHEQSELALSGVQLPRDEQRRHAGERDYAKGSRKPGESALVLTIGFHAGLAPDLSPPPQR